MPQSQPPPPPRARGIARFEEIMGFPPPAVADPFLDMTLDHLFANVWSRGGLSTRERRLVTLAILTCQGHESSLALHLRAARRADLTDSDIDELMLHIAHYAGWSCAALGTGVARKLRAAAAPAAEPPKSSG
jgi:4-carboxymuconolactone decarboxylase